MSSAKYSSRPLSASGKGAECSWIPDARHRRENNGAPGRRHQRIGRFGRPAKSTRWSESSLGSAAIWHRQTSKSSERRHNRARSSRHRIGLRTDLRTYPLLQHNHVSTETRSVVKHVQNQLFQTMSALVWWWQQGNISQRATKAKCCFSYAMFICFSAWGGIIPWGQLSCSHEASSSHWQRSSWRLQQPGNCPTNRPYDKNETTGASSKGSVHCILCLGQRRWGASCHFFWCEAAGPAGHSWHLSKRLSLWRSIPPP